MAIELGIVRVDDLTENNYKVLGIDINTNSDSNGIFAVNYTTLSQAKSNLKNLLLTKKGERIGLPTFGCDIWKVLFEPIVDGDIDFKVENSIIEAVETWLPYLEITQIVLESDTEYKDGNKIGVEVNFALKDNPNLTESITINVK
jgi:phage baseplate assembly protein W